MHNNPFCPQGNACTRYSWVLLVNGLFLSVIVEYKHPLSGQFLLKEYSIHTVSYCSSQDARDIKRHPTISPGMMTINDSWYPQARANFRFDIPQDHVYRNTIIWKVSGKQQINILEINIFLRSLLKAYPLVI